MESNDISKRTVLVLLVLTLVVSVVGTWTILSQPTTIYTTVTDHGPAAGKVSLGIAGEPVEVDTSASPQAGEVKLNILK